MKDRRSFLSQMLFLGLGMPASAAGILRHSKSRPLRNTSPLPAQGAYLYLFSKVLQWVDLMHLPRTVRNLGFDGIDLTLRPGGHIEPGDVKDKLPGFVRACRDEGLKTPLLTTAIDNANDINTRSILETAAKSGIPSYRLGWYRYDLGASINTQANEFTEKLHAIAALNEELNIAGHYQNHAGQYFGSSIWDLSLAMDKIHSGSLKVQYDIRHAMVEGTLSWQQDFKLIAPHIGSVVLKDFSWSATDSVDALNQPLGKGIIDFKSYFQLLHEMQIEVPAIIHVEHELGGAQEGDRNPHLPGETILNAVKADRTFADALSGK